MKDNKKERFGIKVGRKNKKAKPLERFTPQKENQNEWKEKLARHRVKILMRALIFAAVLVAATVFFYVRYLNKVYVTYDVLSSVDFTVSTSAKVIPFEDRLLIYGNDGAKCVSNKGEVIWNVTYEMQNPMVDIDGDVVGIADYNGSTIYMMNTTGILGEVGTGMPIREFRVSAKELVIAVLDDSSITPIYIYDKEGEKKAFFSTNMRNSGYPISLCISDSGYLVGISYLYVDNASYKTNIAFYNFGEVGQNQTDNLVSGYTYAGAVVPYMEFVNDSKAVAFADNRLMFYEGAEKPTSMGEVLVQDEICGVYCAEEYVALVHNNTDSEERYRIDIYNDGGKCIDSVFFDEEFTDILFDNDRIIVYGATECLIHKVGGIDKFRGSFDNGVLAVIPTDVSTRFVLVSNNAIETIELK